MNRPEPTGPGGDEAWPPARGTEPDLSLVVGRALGTVVVTVDGELDPVGCRLLRRLLADLIEGQGNLAVAVDLSRAIVQPDALAVFSESARQAQQHGTRFILKEPPTGTREALEVGAGGDLVEILPRSGSRS